MLDSRLASISVIIPAYNVAAYVGAAIDSVLEQTCTPHEIVIIDDGSTDRTPEILSQYEKCPNVRCYRQRNKGLGDTRNRGAELATGEYLYFFDGDDLLDKSFIQRMNGLIAACNGPDLVMFSGEAFATGQEVGSHIRVGRYRRACEADQVSGIEALELLSANGGLSAQACLYLAKAQFWRLNRLAFSSELHEDENILVPLLVSASSVVIRDEIFFWRRIRKGSIMTSSRSRDHAMGRESNLRQSLQDFYLVPYSAIGCRKVIRKRCRNAAIEYTKVSCEVGYRANRHLLFSAVIKTRSLNLLQKICVWLLRSKFSYLKTRK